MYREDYANAGIRMLPVVKPDGHAAALRIVVCSVFLIPVSLTPHFLGMAGDPYAVMAIALGLAFTYLSVRVSSERTVSAARNVLLGSVLYLPALLAAMIVDSL
jgi:protoheme IX farnesyltransferase